MVIASIIFTCAHRTSSASLSGNFVRAVRLCTFHRRVRLLKKGSMLSTSIVSLACCRIPAESLPPAMKPPGVLLSIMNWSPPQVLPIHSSKLLYRRDVSIVSQPPSLSSWYSSPIMGTLGKSLPSPIGPSPKTGLSPLLTIVSGCCLVS